MIYNGDTQYGYFANKQKKPNHSVLNTDFDNMKLLLNEKECIYCAIVTKKKHMGIPHGVTLI